MSLYSLDLSLPASLGDDAAGRFASMPMDIGGTADAVPVSSSATRAGRDHRGAWTLRWTFMDRPDITGFAAMLQDINERSGFVDHVIGANSLTLGEIAETDWLQQSYQAFAPFSLAGFYIYGSHASPHPGPGEQPILIDAATAFGSGEHGTTAGCLDMLRRLQDEGFKPNRVLDLGTGSGILAIASWMVWHCPVTATDIDAEAVRVAQRHCAANGVPEGAIICYEADGFTRRLRQDGPFDLVIANILAPPLREMAGDIAAVTADGGCILLSGMLDEQVGSVVPLYEAAGCSTIDKILKGDWASVLLRRAAPHPA